MCVSVNPGEAALLALGSNLGDRHSNLNAAVEDLRATAGIEIVRVSSFIETEPVGMSGQPWFLNGAVSIRTSLSPRMVLERCLAIELAHGRDRSVDHSMRHASRTLDIDLLLFGDRIINEPGLHVPHPRMHERLFAMVPAAEISGDMRHPTLDATIAELLSRKLAAAS